MSKDSRMKLLQTALKQIERSYGKGSVMRLIDKSQEKVSVIPTGSITLDWALGIGGYPRGRIVEIYGHEASGKTTLALLAMAQVQKLKGTVLFIDAEHAFDPSYASIIGVDVKDENLFIAQPDYGEQAFDIMETFIRSSAIDLIIVDSVAALVPKAELTGEMEENSIGLQARMMSKALRKLTGIISKTNTVVLFINQIREKIGGYGNPETTTGGRALKFFASVRIEVRKGEVIRKGDDIIGHTIKMKVVKNKLAPPYRTASFDLIYGKGVDRFAEYFDLGVQLGIIKRAGSWYSLDGEQIAQGREKSILALKEDEKLFEKLKNLINEYLKQGGEHASAEGKEQQ